VPCVDKKKGLRPEKHFGYIKSLNFIYFINLNYYLLLVQIDDFHEEIKTSETEDQLIFDDQNKLYNSNSDAIGNNSSK